MDEIILFGAVGAFTLVIGTALWLVGRRIGNLLFGSGLTIEVVPVLAAAASVLVAAIQASDERFIWQGLASLVIAGLFALMWLFVFRPAGRRSSR